MLFDLWFECMIGYCGEVFGSVVMVILMLFGLWFEFVIGDCDEVLRSVMIR